MGQGVLKRAPSEHLPTRRSAAIVIVALLFCAGFVPLAHDYYFAHVDEHLYADAAITMVHSGDWTTAYDSAGYPRFQKPILTYWFIAASYEIFGISALTSRLPSILAGGLTLLITYALALRMTRRFETATLAMLILASTPPFILAAMRANPDIFLTLFITISAYGFADLLFSEQPGSHSGWLAYVGVGLATMAKGVPALIFVAYVWLFAWLSLDIDGRRRVFAIAPLVAGFAIPAVWFVAMLHAHGVLVAHVMWNDQVRARLSVDVLATPLRVVAMAAQYILFFMPWFLVIAIQWWTSGREFARAVGLQFLRFVTGFALLYALVFGLNPTMNGHYLLPACPLMAIVLAEALASSESVVARTVLNWICVIIVSALALVALVTIVQPGRAVPAIVAGLAGATFAGATLLTIRRLSMTRLTIRVAVTLYLFFPLAAVLLRPWLLPDFGRQVIAALRRAEVAKEKQIRFVGPPGLASYIRVDSGGTITVVDSLDLAPRASSQPPVIIAPAADAPELQSRGYEITPAGSVIEKASATAIAFAVIQLRLTSFLESSKEPFILAIRP